MSRVVLRCPNCGTTRGAPGECEACHEAEVRFYCTNHTPGLWLDKPACSQCGARFGEAASPPPRAAPRPAPPAATPPFAPSRPAEPRSAPRPAPSRAAAPPAPERSPWLSRRSPPPPGPGEESRPPGMDALVRGWPDLLRTATRGRRMPPPAPFDPAALPGAALGGCIRRLFFLALILVLLVMTMFFFAGGPLLEILLNILLSS